MASNSTSLATNISRLSATTNVAAVESCNTSQSIQIVTESVIIGNVNCKKVEIGNTSSSQHAVCTNQTQISIVSKVVVDQLAKALATAGLMGGLFQNARSESDNFVDVQNNIMAVMQSSCNNEQTAVIKNRSFIIGNITGEECEIMNHSFDQTAVCLNSIIGDFTNSTEVSQVAEATSKTGIDLGEILGILIAICVIMMLSMLFIPFMTSMFRGSNMSNVLKHGDTDTISALKDQISILKAKISSK